MHNELDALEARVQQLITLCQWLRADNRRLREELASAGESGQHCQAKVTEARARLQALLERIPADSAPARGESTLAEPALTKPAAPHAGAGS